ncbi:glutathione S-transferase [Mycena rebaudengoi]|nr:glutathione S-transferase [Mycena rebaudengoi]
MTLKLFSSPYSTCTKRVATVLIEKKPFEQVPYIDDDGFVPYESRAICRYIADKYANQGKKLVPTDLKRKAVFEQAAFTEYLNFDPFSSRAVSEAVSNLNYRMMGMETNKAKLEENLKTLSAKLDAYELILGKQKYLAGNERRLVPPSGPNVTRWFNDLQARESWVTVKDGISKISY